jgi:cytochrome P450
MRTPARDLRLGPYTLPAGTLININLGVMGNSALNYESPDLYLPVGPAKSSRSWFLVRMHCETAGRLLYVLKRWSDWHVSCLLAATNEVLEVLFR